MTAEKSSAPSEWSAFRDLGSLDRAWAERAAESPMTAREEFDGPLSRMIELTFADGLNNYRRARAMEGVREWARSHGKNHPELTDQIARIIGDGLRRRGDVDWLWDVWRGQLGHHGAPIE